MSSICIGQTLVAAIFLITAISPVHAQTSSESPQTTNNDHNIANPKTSRSRVWTNDDVTALRTPTDIYEEQKMAAAEKPAVEKAAASSTEKNRTTSATASSQQKASTDGLPNDAAAVEALIAKTQDDIVRKQKALDDAVADAIRASTALERSTLQSKVEVDKVDLTSSKEELNQLQTKLAALKQQTSSAADANNNSSQPKP